LSFEILTLWEIMSKFCVWHLVKLLQHIHEHREAIQKLATDPDHRDERMPEEIAEHHLSGIMRTAHEISQEIRLQSTNDLVWEGGGTFWMKYKVGITWQEAYYELDVLRRAIEADLQWKTFAFVPPQNAELLDQMAHHWNDIWKVIPDAKPDCEEALHCYALERNTAAVFHSMRAAEHGLRKLSKRLRVKVFDKGKQHPVELATWNKVITEINNKIAAIRLLPMSQKRQQQLELYSDAGQHCLFMKDIWRNDISHAKKPHKATEALAAVERVKDFLQFLAKHLRN